jgi:pyruvate/2-oxoglutarate dehydrogenase complex dihydrolipoamide dehydrogenase (E3) component
MELLKNSRIHYHSARPVKLENRKLQLDDNSSIPETEYNLLALGRSPNTNLGLEQAHVAYDKSGIAVNKNLTTSNSAIFAIGDCTQNPQFTHLAANHGKFVVKKIMVPFARRRDRALPRVTFVHPSIASVGSLEQTNTSHLFELDFTHLDRARTNFNENSRGVISVDTRTGLILGASLLGDFSEELINVMTLMMDERIPVLRMTDFITPYPTYGNILHNLSRDYMSYLSQHWKLYPLSSLKQFISYLLH